MKGQAVRAECLLTYSDLLELEWVLADKVHEWEWRGDVESLVEGGQSTLKRIRQMIKDYPRDADDLRPDPKGGREDG